MKEKLRSLVLALAVISSSFLMAQTQINEEEKGLSYVGKSNQVKVVPSLNSRSTLNPAVPLTEEPQDGRYSGLRKSKVDVVIGKDQQKEDDFFVRHPGKLDQAINVRSLENDFVVNNTVGSPSDPALAVGPDHVVVVYNTGFIIYDKDGVDLTGPLNVNNIFSNGGCCDLTASYDNLADRWVLTYLFVGAGMELAVSDGPNPLTANWFIYSFPQVNDYNKLSVWRDGYYVTDNGPNDVWVIDRDAALAGDASANIQGFNIPGVQGQGFTSAQVLNITDDNHPTTGGAPLIYMRDDGFAGVTQDEIRIWTIDVDFDTPANSDVSAPEVFPATPFINVFDGGAFDNLTQPGGGTDIDALQSTIMNQAQFRKFATHNSAIFNFVVDTDASAGELAGIRWYEFRQSGDGQPWTMFQEGTFTAPDGKHAWNGSMAMDSQGNIGMGYNTMAGPTTPNPTDNRVAAAYTGRFASDAAGVMSVTEEVYGSAGNIAGFRFGDYAKMDVDPSNDADFWFITEYQNANHVAVFRLAPDTTNDVGVVSIDTPTNGALTNSETVSVTVFNYGEAEASGFDVTYQVDGGSLIIEAFPGTIASQTSEVFTFTATADLSTEGQTYSITSCTTLAGDENTTNDCVTSDVTHLLMNDIGVTEITAPVSGTGLGNEVVTVTIENFGSSDQSGFDVFYTLNGGAPVTETVGDNVPAGGSISYSFVATADLSNTETYTLEACTDLSGDQDNSNDCTSEDVTNQLAVCVPVANLGCNVDGIKRFVLGTIDADDGENGCNGNGNGYVDRRDLMTDIDRDPAANPNVLQAQHNWTNATGEGLSVWIDFDDSGTFEVSERLISGETFSVSGTLESFDLDIPADAPLGSHILRAKAIDITDAGDILDPCSDFSYGEVHDYTVNIIDSSLSVEENTLGEFNIISQGNNQFLINLATSQFSERLAVEVFNMAGQKLLYKTLENETGNGYEYNLDMSYAASGVYVVRLGNNEFGTVRRIIVE